jgi:hypothetical protein
VSAGLVVVLAVAAAVPLLLGLLPGVRLPGPLLEIVAGIVLGPSLLGWVRPDPTISAIALLGLSFLLFLAGYEVDLRRFRGSLGRRVALSLGLSLLAAGAVTGVLALASVSGAALIGVALLATSLGLVVPVLADADALDRPVGRMAVAGASAGEVAAVVLLSVGNAGPGDRRRAGRRRAGLGAGVPGRGAHPAAPTGSGSGMNPATLPGCSPTTRPCSPACAPATRPRSPPWSGRGRRR